MVFTLNNPPKVPKYVIMPCSIKNVGTVFVLINIHDNLGQVHDFYISFKESDRFPLAIERILIKRLISSQPRKEQDLLTEELAYREFVVTNSLDFRIEPKIGTALQNVLGKFQKYYLEAVYSSILLEIPSNLRKQSKALNDFAKAALNEEKTAVITSALAS